jgi:hypothetical protein
MIFRPLRVIAVVLLLSTFGLLAMLLKVWTDPICIDDLSEVTEIALQRSQQGNTEALNLKVAFDKEKNQWCYIETY